MRFDNMEKSLKLAPQADERSKRNEKDIVELQSQFEHHLERLEEQDKQRKQDRKWAIGTMLTIFGMILTIAIFIANLYL